MSKDLKRVKKLDNSLGENILKRRRHLHLTQEELSKICGLSAPSISEIEHGRQPTKNNLKKIAKALKCTVEYLEGKTDTPTQPKAKELPLAVHETPATYGETIKHSLPIDGEVDFHIKITKQAVSIEIMKGVK